MKVCDCYAYLISIICREATKPPERSWYVYCPERRCAPCSWTRYVRVSWWRFTIVTASYRAYSTSSVTEFWLPPQPPFRFLPFHLNNIEARSDTHPIEHEYPRSASHLLLEKAEWVLRFQKHRRQLLSSHFCSEYSASIMMDLLFIKRGRHDHRVCESRIEYFPLIQFRCTTSAYDNDSFKWMRIFLSCRDIASENSVYPNSGTSILSAWLSSTDRLA